MEPTVIDEELCRRCISVRRTAAQQTGEPQDTQKTKETASSTPFTEVSCLIFSFKNVLKIDNLIGFERLVKLQLDNNIIEKVRLPEEPVPSPTPTPTPTPNLALALTLTTWANNGVGPDPDPSLPIP